MYFVQQILKLMNNKRADYKNFVSVSYSILPLKIFQINLTFQTAEFHLSVSESVSEIIFEKIKNIK